MLKSRVPGVIYLYALTGHLTTFPRRSRLKQKVIPGTQEVTVYPLGCPQRQWIKGFVRALPGRGQTV